MSTAKVTVCVPSIPPRALMLKRALGSVGRQTHPPAAVAVAHDLDGDGAAQTRNEALHMARTEWVAFLDDDDQLGARHLERLVRHQQETGADLVYPWFDIRGPDGEDYNHRDPLGAMGQDIDLAELDHRNWIPVTYLVRRDLAEAVGGFPRLFSERWPHDNCEDWGFLKDLRDAGATFSHLPERTWVWNWHGLNTSGRPWVQVRGVGCAA